MDYGLQGLQKGRWQQATPYTSTAGHHSSFEGIYPTVWKWPLKAKLPHIHRWVFMVTVPKRRLIVGRNAWGCVQGPRARTNAGPLCLAPGKKRGNLQGRCCQEEMPSWYHLQIQWAISLEDTSSASTSHHPAATTRPRFPERGLWEPFHVSQPAPHQLCSCILLLLHDYQPFILMKWPILQSPVLPHIAQAYGGCSSVELLVHGKARYISALKHLHFYPVVISRGHFSAVVKLLFFLPLLPEGLEEQ